jgi:hypothetical protein
MRKASGKLGSKPSNFGPDSFVDQFSESQELQGRLQTIVHELEATVRMLELNLETARRSARSRPDWKK